MNAMRFIVMVLLLMNLAVAAVAGECRADDDLPPGMNENQWRYFNEPYIYTDAGLGAVFPNRNLRTVAEPGTALSIRFGSYTNRLGMLIDFAFYSPVGREQLLSVENGYEGNTKPTNVSLRENLVRGGVTFSYALVRNEHWFVTTNVAMGLLSYNTHPHAAKTLPNRDKVLDEYVMDRGGPYISPDVTVAFLFTRQPEYLMQLGIYASVGTTFSRTSRLSHSRPDPSDAPPENLGLEIAPYFTTGISVLGFSAESDSVSTIQDQKSLNLKDRKCRFGMGVWGVGVPLGKQSDTYHPGWIIEMQLLARLLWFELGLFWRMLGNDGFADNITLPADHPDNPHGHDYTLRADGIMHAIGLQFNPLSLTKGRFLRFSAGAHLFVEIDVVNRGSTHSVNSIDDDRKLFTKYQRRRFGGGIGVHADGGMYFVGTYMRMGIFLKASMDLFGTSSLDAPIAELETDANYNFGAQWLPSFTTGVDLMFL